MRQKRAEFHPDKCSTCTEQRQKLSECLHMLNVSESDNEQTETVKLTPPPPPPEPEPEPDIDSLQILDPILNVPLADNSNDITDTPDSKPKIENNKVMIISENQDFWSQILKWKPVKIVSKILRIFVRNFLDFWDFQPLGSTSSGENHIKNKAKSRA